MYHSGKTNHAPTNNPPHDLPPPLDRQNHPPPTLSTYYGAISATLWLIAACATPLLHGLHSSTPPIANGHIAQKRHASLTLSSPTVKTVDHPEAL